MEIKPITEKPVTKKGRRGRPKGSKNRVVKAMRAVKRVETQTASLDKDSMVAALGLLLVAVDILKKTIN